jgi:hypothetical protein
MVDEEFKLNVFGEHVAIHFNNKTFYTTSFNHTFKKPGNYTVDIEVWDDFGDYNKRTVLVVVSDRYFFNYSFNSTAFPGKHLAVAYVLYDFFGRNLTGNVIIHAFGKNYRGNGSVIITVPDDTPPGNHTLTFFYKNQRVNASVFVPRVLRILDLDLDRTILDKDEPVHAIITALDQTGGEWNLTCELRICVKNCTSMSVPANTELSLNDLYWEPGYYTISAECMDHVSVEYLLVPRIQNLSYNYSAAGNVTTITLRNTGNTRLNTTLTYCSNGLCRKLNISLEKNQTKTISLKNPETVSIKYANKTVSLPITGSFGGFMSFNPWFLWVSLLAILVIIFFTRVKSKGK